MIAINTLLITSTSASIEMVNDSCYYNEAGCQVILNGEILYSDHRYNVISFYRLIPETLYELLICSSAGEELYRGCFTTAAETICLNGKAFGLKGDGISDDTMALQTAVMACPPGGRIFIEPGVYYIRALFLKSDITLELAEGAVLLAHTDRNNYPILPQAASEDLSSPAAYIGTWEGEPAFVYASVITGLHLENTALIGQGIVDGNSHMGDWWSDPKVMRNAWRPKLLFFSHSKNIVLQGITFRNSPSWTIHPYFSEHLKLIDLKIENPKDSPNTDGINPESCEDVSIIGTSISVGDDCIAVKSGKLMMGSRFKKAAKDIEIRNCLMEHGHGAVVLGSEMSGGIYNLHVSRCLFRETDRGLRIKTRRGRGKEGVIDDIVFENIKMEGVLTPLVINMFYHCDSDGKTEYVRSKEKLPVDEGTPELGSFIFKNIECKDCEVAVLFFYGLPERKIASVHLENIRAAFKKDAKEGIPAMMCSVEPVAKMGGYINQVEHLFMKNVEIAGYEGEAFRLHNISSLENG